MAVAIAIVFFVVAGWLLPIAYCLFALTMLVASQAMAEILHRLGLYLSTPSPLL